MSEIYKAPEAPLHDEIKPTEYGSLEAALAGDFEVKPVERMREARESLKGFMGVFWLGLIIYMVISGMVGAVAGIVVTPLAEQIALNETMTIWQIIGQISSQLLSMFITLPLGAGLFMICLKHSVGAPIRAELVVKYYNKAVPLFLTTLLMYLLVVIGFVLFIVPGLYLMVAFMYAIPLVVEKNMTPWQALNTSRKVMTRKFLGFMGFYFLSILVLILGMLALFVGLIWALPIASLAMAILYRDVFGIEAQTLLEN